MRKFICLSGKAQHGKDTTANFLKSELEKQGYSVIIVHQADLLKFICKNYFGWNGEKDEYGRDLLQKVGTDVIRKAKPDFWVDFIGEVTSFFDGRWAYILIPDTRFPNEIEKLRTPTSEVFHVKVVRPNFVSPLTTEQQLHSSETALDDVKSDYVILNDGDTGSLRDNVAAIALDIISKTTEEH